MRLYIFIICFTFFCCKEKNVNKKLSESVNSKVSRVGMSSLVGRFYKVTLTYFRIYVET